MIAWEWVFLIVLASTCFGVLGYSVGHHNGYNKGYDDGQRWELNRWGL